MNPASVSPGSGVPKNVIGQPVYRYIAPEYRKPYRRLKEQAFLGKPGSMESRVISLKGSVHAFESYMVSLHDVRENIPPWSH